MPWLPTGGSSFRAARTSRRGVTAEQPREIEYRPDPLVPLETLESLFAVAWDQPSRRDFDSVLRHSLSYVCAYHEEQLVGFVNLAWDGGVHAFLVDATVHPDYRRRGIGRGLVLRAVQAAREHGVEWVHVDFEPRLGAFYRGCGFRDTDAGLMRLDPGPRAGD